MRFQVSRIRSFALVACSATAVASAGAGCAEHGHDGPQLRASRSKLNNSIEVTGTGTNPENAVGWVTLPGYACTGTIIQRRASHLGALVLTAGHCFCNGNGITLAGPNTNMVKFSRKSLASINDSTASWKFGGCSSDDSVSDLAIVRVSDEASVLDFAEVPRVYTGADFEDRALNLKLSAPQVVFPPYLMTSALDSSWGDGPGSATPPFDYITQADYWGSPALSFESSYAVAGIFGNYRGRYIEARDPILVKGDSGGPLTFHSPSGPVIFGVASREFDIGFSNWDEFSPTYDNGNHNGQWIRSFFTDADEDGVDDDVDNSPPSQCKDDPFKCANPDQADTDGDGVGDVSDNCPPSLCVARGWSPQACWNPDQIDTDQDGVGDACDSCVYFGNGETRKGHETQLADADGDGAGDACDTCPNSWNPRRGCLSDSDCFVNGSVQTKCVGSHLGKCSGPGAESCTSSSQCPINTAASGSPTHFNCAMGFGRCAKQLDDLDGDMRGGQCDLCEGNTDVRISTNANAFSETRKNATPLGDQCDPVPQLDSRGNVGRVEFGTNAVLDALGSTTSYTILSQTTGLGSGGTTSTIGQNAGLRHCNCVHPVTLEVEDKQSCLANLCAPNDNSYAATTIWQTMRTRTGAWGAVPGIPNATTSVPFFGTYNATVNCNDNFVHLDSFGECRLGTQFFTRWDHPFDRDNWGIPTISHPTRGAQTYGVILSHVIRSGSNTSSRDATNGLRDTFEYIQTPLIREVAPAIGRSWTNCLFAGCMLTWRPDWVIYPPDLFRADPTPIELNAYYGRIAEQSDGSFAVLSRPTDAAFDVTTSLSPEIVDFIRSGNMAFRTSVEGSTSLAATLSTNAFAVAMPAEWRQVAERPVGIRYDGSQIVAMHAAAPPELPTTPHPFGHVLFVPGDRDGAGAVFSAREQAVYLVGGHRTAGKAIGEIWRYNLHSDAWTRLFMDTPTATLPSDVRAIAYDPSSSVIVAIDEGSFTGTRRIVRINLLTGIIKSVAELPADNSKDKYSLIYIGNGEYFLLRGTRSAPTHSVLRFFLRSSTVDWIGRRDAAVGELLDDAFSTRTGIVAPVATQGNHDIVVVSTVASTTAPTSL